MDLLGEPSATGMMEEEIVEEVVVEEPLHLPSAHSSFGAASSFAMPTSGPLAEWHAQHERELAEKEKAAAQRRQRALELAKEEMQRLYDERNKVLSKTKAENRQAEKSFVEERDAQSSAGSSWQRVDYLISLAGTRSGKSNSDHVSASPSSNTGSDSTKAVERKHAARDTSRFRQLINQLKHA